MKKVKKAYFAQEYLDALTPKEREVAEALMAADTREELDAVIKKLCDEAEKEAIEALNKQESSNLPALPES